MKTRFMLGLLVSASLIFINCSEDSTTAPGDGEGTLTIRLTDAPFPYDLVAEANVTVFKVEARRADYEEDTETMDSMDDQEENEEGSPFITLMEEEIPVNLLTLVNGSTAMLANVEVPEGIYDLVRVYVRGVNVVLKDGRTFDLKVPSGEQTGIKVFIKPGIQVAGGLSADLLLDFDVSKSFVAKGNIKSAAGIKGFNFKPVIKASNLSTAGSLIGTVTSLEEEMETALEGAQISVFAADTLNTTGFTDMAGNYTIMGLDAGNYRVLAELEGFVSSDTLEVSILAGNNTIQDFVLEQEAMEETEGN